MCCECECANLFGTVQKLKNRGVEDILIAAIDRLKGFPEAIAAVFPRTQVQLCIVHMVRNSLRYVSWKHRKAVVKDLRPIYLAVTPHSHTPHTQRTEW